ncbi:hypothetical protein [Lysobacter sp. Root690]|uniref:hypothetical protein n=1 Tax=Lysobacter sp. Root690 TaxID=1736588 RepID=UPI0012FB4373|nr:hypothetical protein [Lysobacter sp. Root690]
MDRTHVHLDRYGSVRSCAPIHAAQAALQGLAAAVLGAVSAPPTGENPTPAQAVARLSQLVDADNLIPGATVSTSAIRVL